jgi:hypothetical protein
MATMWGALEPLVAFLYEHTVPGSQQVPDAAPPME